MIRSHALRATITGFLLAVALASAHAQDPSRIDLDVRRDLSSALGVVRPLVRDDPQRAIEMLVALDAEYPGNAQILMLLGEAYRTIGDLERARSSYERCLIAQPTHLQAGAMIGLLYLQGGETGKSDEAFESLLRRTEYSLNVYRTIASTLSQNGYNELALRYYEEGRARRDDDYILTMDIAFMHKSMGDYEQALAEYFRVIEASTKQQRLAKIKITELLHDSGANQDQLLALLEQESRRKAPYRGVIMEILAIAYLERGMLESALDIAMVADQGTQSNGAVLFSVAETAFHEYRRREDDMHSAERTAYFDLSLRALEAYLDAYPSSPRVPNANLMLIDLLVDMTTGRVQTRPTVEMTAAVTRALQAMDWVIASFPGTEHAEQAYLKKGDVVLLLQKNPEKALEIYEEGMSKSRFHPVPFAERLGKVYLITERYDEGKKHCTRLIASNSPDLRETGVYYTGLMLVFTGEYETARDTLTSIAETNPSSQFANDAIDVSWSIEEGLRGDKRALDAYVEALHAEVADDTVRVVGALTRAIEHSAGAPLRGRALIMLGDVYRGQRRFDLALETFEIFCEDFPTDTRVPDVRRKIGQVQEQGFGNMQLALETYEDILLSYPHYIFLDEVREDVVRIRRAMEHP
jgi:tetratricopeptide (TPR) repeat protein